MTKVELLEQEVKDLKNRLDKIKKSATKTLEMIEDLERQDKTKYSEEDADELVYSIIGEYGKHYGIMIDGAKINELFDKFKKK